MHKARLVCDIRSHGVSIGCDDTFSPVTKTHTIRTYLSLAMARKWYIHPLDVKILSYMGTCKKLFTCINHLILFIPHTSVCLPLTEGPYGIKQAPRAWCQRFANFLLHTWGLLSPKVTHHCLLSLMGRTLFIYCCRWMILFILLLLMLSENVSSYNSKLSSLCLIRVCWLFFGIVVTKTPSYILISQQKYAQEILERVGIASCKPVAIPVD